MADKITRRVSRIITGSVHALINSMEDKAPEAVMAQAIREVDEAIASIRIKLGKVLAVKHIANKRLVERNSQHENLSVQIENAIKQSRDDLAQAGIGAQLDIEAQIPIIEQNIVENSEQEKELEGYIAALQAKKRELQEELNVFRQQKDDTHEVIEGVKAVFDRVVTPQSTVQLNELETITINNRVQERLATIKAQLTE